MDHNVYDWLYKLVVIGDSSAGKTSLLQRFAGNTFTDSFVSTIGVDFKAKVVELNGQAIKLQIWDGSGQERFRSVVTSYCQGAAGIIFVYDVTNMESFSNVKKWHTLADKSVGKLLLGNKCDRETDRVVEYETAKEFADELGIPLLETSAKDGTNVELAFMTMAAQIQQSLPS